MYTCFCFSVRRHSRTVLRPDEVIRSGRITLHDKVSLPRRLCRQGLFQYRGEFENSLFSRLTLNTHKRLLEIDGEIKKFSLTYPFETSRSKIFSLEILLFISRGGFFITTMDALQTRIDEGADLPLLPWTL